MAVDVEQVRASADDFGFQVESVEKVFRLLELLGDLSKQTFLRPRLALKGGTALNLFVFDLPRLSVDLDFNYIGSIERPTMMADKPEVERALRGVCARHDLRVTRSPDDHVGGKWRLSPGCSSPEAGSAGQTPARPPTL